MQININQQKIAFGAKYEIFNEDEKEYFAKSEIFTFLSVIHLTKIGESIPCLTIKKKWSWFKANYEIEINKNKTVKFITKSIWKPHYQCIYGNDVYDIYSHRSRKKSIFKNNIQIAWFDKEAVSWYDGDNYKMILNQDCYKELIIAFCLIIDNYRHRNDDGATLTYDFGNIGGEMKKFDNSWSPK